MSLRVKQMGLSNMRCDDRKTREDPLCHAIKNGRKRLAKRNKHDTAQDKGTKDKTDLLRYIGFICIVEWS
jgi:hypothetical protein